MIKLLITRPKKDAVLLAKKISEMGIATIQQPVLNVRVVDGPEYDFENAQALLTTSTNGIRAFVEQYSQRSLRVLAVGDSSAQEAKKLGFSWVESAGGDVNDLIKLVRARLSPANGTLIHPAGTKVAGTLYNALREDGFDYKRLVLYEAKKIIKLNLKTLNFLDRGNIDGVLLFSPRTAEVFETLLVKAKRDFVSSGLDALCLSKNVANALFLDWKSVKVAQKPTQESLLKTVKSCYT